MKAEKVAAPNPVWHDGGDLLASRVCGGACCSLLGTCSFIWLGIHCPTAFSAIPPSLALWHAALQFCPESRQEMAEPDGGGSRLRYHWLSCAWLRGVLVEDRLKGSDEQVSVRVGEYQRGAKLNHVVKRSICAR